MSKVVGMLVALAAFFALPAVALAGGDNVSSGNTQSGTISQGASGGDSTASGGDGGSGGGDGGDASSGDGGDAGNQAAIVQQNAGDDANASINQSQSFGGDSSIGGGGDDGDGGGDGDGDDDGDSDDDDSVSGTGGGDVESVTLARTGFDAWLLALLGGVSLAGGISLLAVQRRGRTDA